MLQKTYFAENTGDMYKVLGEMTMLKEYKKAKSVLVLMYVNGISRAEGKKYFEAIKIKMSRAKIAGISVISSQKDWNRIGVNVSFLFFESSDVNVYDYPCKDYDEDGIINDFSKVIEATKDLKVVLTYPVGVDRDFTKVLEALTLKYNTIVFFGGLASARDYPAGEGHFYSPDDITPGRNSVVGPGHLENLFQGIGVEHGAQSFSVGNDLVSSGCVLVTISGEKLQEQARYALGWKPLGIGHPVTGRVESDDMGNACLTEIGGISATSVYKKYLDVDTDEYFLDNVCEFPFVITRNGVDIARVPLYSGEEGKLYFSGDIRRDEVLRLSYANPTEVFRASKIAADEIAQFQPEAVIMTICYNRFHFLKEEEYKEIEYFLDYHPDTMYGFGGYEILKGYDCGGILNSALVALALREGEPRECKGTLVVNTKEDKKKIKPLEERLLTFIDTSTNELEKAYDEAEAANEAKSAFLSNMSHEIRTPINAILGMNEMILRECKDETIIEYANNIDSASHSLLGLVNDILDFSKINAGKMEIIPVEYELASVLNDLITMIQKRAEDKGLKLRVNVDPTIPHLLYGDEIRIKQIITNILTNAVKYTEKGGIVLAVAYEYYTKNNAEEFDDDICCSLNGDIKCCSNKNIILKVSIEDTGIGIKEEDMATLYNSFERVDEERNRTIEGTGLGMSITQNLLELMGSKLTVESEYGVGSKFSFNIVQRIVDFTPLGDFNTAIKRALNRRKEYHESFIAPEARILVVDDTEMNLTVIRNLLKQTQIQIDTALSGQEGLKLMSKNKYDIIYLDHRMPEMDGIECLQRLKADTTGININTPVIALTANAVSGSREYYLNAGFDNYLSKPINSEQLESMMSTLLPVSKVRSIQKIKEVEKKLPDWIWELQFVHVDLGIKNCGDAESYLNALRAYMDSFIENRKYLLDSFNEKRIGDYTTKIHALKSSSRIIGAKELGDLAEYLEKAGDAGDWSIIESYTDEFVSYYSALAYSLRFNLRNVDRDGENEADKPEITMDKLNEAYLAIKEMAQLFDYDTVSGIMNTLSEYTIPESERDKYEALKQAIVNANWDEINRLMEG